MWPPIEISEHIPPGTIYFIPPDVTEAMHHATKTMTACFEAMLRYCLAMTLFDDPAVWRFLLLDLLAEAERKAQAATYAMAGAELLIEAAGAERRIGAVVNLGT